MAKWANTPTSSFRLWLDCDGVLADFDAGFQNAFGLSSEAYEELHGTKAFWKAVRDELNFFGNLPLMPGAMELYNAVSHLRPAILTGCPFGNWAEHQKFGWRNKHFPGVPMVTCLSRNKRDYCKPGDILVDDLDKYRHLWEEAGGTFILHTSAASTIEQLRLLGII